MTDVFEVLGADHAEVKGILAALEGAGAHAGELAEQLVIEESKHEAAEEMHFWPAVREHVPGGDQFAETALAQEREGKKLLDKLRKATPGDPGFSELVHKFSEEGLAHIEFEEARVWPALRAALTPEEAAELGKKIESAKESAPTRPHPEGPDKAGGLKSVGLAAAAVDKARDKLTGRG